MLLADKSIVVTGGNSGIGKAIVLAAAAEGANVVVDYRMHPEYTAEVMAAAARAGGRAVGVEADVSRTEDLHRIIETAVRELRPARRPGQQRGHRNPHVAAGDQRSRLRQGDGGQPQERVLRRPVRGAAVHGARQRRADRDDLLHPRRLADARQHRLLRLQGRREDAHPHRRRRTGITGNPVRQRRAGRGEHPDQRRHRDGPGSCSGG